jgi:hypothetical protein
MLRQNQIHKRHLLLLAAIVLLLQSFAVWHDSTHAFHNASEQCHQLDAINHIPALDAVAVVTINLLPQRVEQIKTPVDAPLATRQTAHYAIRAPPRFS